LLGKYAKRFEGIQAINPLEKIYEGKEKALVIANAYKEEEGSSIQLTESVVSTGISGIRRRKSSGGRENIRPGELRRNKKG